MTRVCPPLCAVYAAAVQALAERVAGALAGADEAFRLGEQLDVENEMAGFAAVRVLGPDALAPYTVGASRFTPEDSAVVVAAFGAFPSYQRAAIAAAGEDRARQSSAAVRDWATARLLHRLRAGPGAAAIVPDSAAWAGWADGGLAWPAWAGLMTQLAPLATPFLDSPAHEQARRRPLDLARGVTRAVRRRAHLSAARLLRWLAILPGPMREHGTDSGATVVAPEPVLRHLELLGGANPRLHLEITLARILLGDMPQGTPR